MTKVFPARGMSVAADASDGRGRKFADSGQSPSLSNCCMNSFPCWELKNAIRLRDATAPMSGETSKSAISSSAFCILSFSASWSFFRALLSASSRGGLSLFWGETSFLSSSRSARRQIVRRISLEEMSGKVLCRRLSSLEADSPIWGIPIAKIHLESG